MLKDVVYHPKTLIRAVNFGINEMCSTRLHIMPSLDKRDIFKSGAKNKFPFIRFCVKKLKKP
jgi:hypothetical protein